MVVVVLWFVAVLLAGFARGGCEGQVVREDLGELAAGSVAVGVVARGEDVRDVVHDAIGGGVLEDDAAVALAAVGEVREAVEVRVDERAERGTALARCVGVGSDRVQDLRQARARGSLLSLGLLSLSGAEAPRGVGSREASPAEVTGAPSGAADAGSLGANPDRRSTSPEGTFTPRASSAAGTEAPSEPARATGSLNGLALKRFPTQQKPAHTSRGGPIAI